ncbi:hypothetical protein [Klebsiella michiganensis]|uniref:hypothetical protein n=1 Tax=Klebsiella michiganensis TaxID=1134687 RepID=UPI0027D44402|nr:hypothetical protein [Klebsiella michiganensis]MDQ4328807.1 hypothetical protein [Klebsiella michiganensis]
MKDRQIPFSRPFGELKSKEEILTHFEAYDFKETAGLKLTNCREFIEMVDGYVRDKMGPS